MLISPKNPLVLGSASPRRREILSSLGIPIEVFAGAIDESPRAGETPDAYLSRIVLGKLADVASRLASAAEGPAAPRVPGVVVADTIVVVDDAILGKPADEAEARVLLGRIVGRNHVVKTRYALSVAPDLATPRVVRTVETVVTMRAASADEVARYAATGEGLDKAGAYAAQGIGAFLVERIDGSFSNVVGLPACEVVADLVRSGLLEAFPARGA